MREIKFNYLEIAIILGCSVRKARVYCAMAKFGVKSVEEDPEIYKNISSDLMFHKREFDFLPPKRKGIKEIQNLFEEELFERWVNGINNYIEFRVLTHDESMFKGRICGPWKVINKVYKPEECENLLHELRMKLIRYIEQGNKVPDKYKKYIPEYNYKIKQKNIFESKTLL